MNSIKVWLETMRLRTLPVSVAGVVMAIGIAWWQTRMRWAPALLCLAFAVLAQIASNMANEYFDWLSGADRAGRVGPRRGVTEGDISPRSLLMATCAVIALAAVTGCCLLPYGEWWLLPVGIVIVLAALAYSAGPWPLSYHGLGEAMVFVFFGLVPVNLTYYVITGRLWEPIVILASMTIGLMSVNVLLVNNYRDVDDDRAAGKRTSVVIFGRQPAAAAYLINGYMAVALLTPLWIGAALWPRLPAAMLAVPAIYLICHTILWWQLTHRDGRALNPLLGMTASLMAAFTIALTIFLITI